MDSEIEKKKGALIKKLVTGGEVGKKKTNDSVGESSEDWE